MDVGFQSLAGTSNALAGMVGLDIDGLADLAGAFRGLYFETGQGSEVTNGVAGGVDMGTLEARTYGVARRIRQTSPVWTIVNDVAGFIGPEVFATADRLERVCPGRRDGPAAWPDDGARRVRDVSHGHHPGRCGR